MKPWALKPDNIYLDVGEKVAYIYVREPNNTTCSIQYLADISKDHPRQIYPMEFSHHIKGVEVI